MNSASDILLQSVRLYKTNAATIGGYLAWLLLPFAGLILVDLVPNEETAAVLGIFLVLIQIVLSIWISLFLIRLVQDLSKNIKPDVPELQRKIRGWIGPLLIVTVLTTLSIIGGLLLLIIPGIMFFIWFSFAQISVVLDGKRGMDALSHSRSLVKGRFFKTAWMVLSGPIFSLILYTLILATIVATISLLTGQNLDAALAESPPAWIIVIDMLGQLFILLPILLIYHVLVYEEFKKPRSEKEKVEKQG